MMAGKGRFPDAACIGKTIRSAAGGGYIRSFVRIFASFSV